MNKLLVIGALVATVFTSTTPVLANASGLTVEEQVTLLSQSQTPIEDFGALDPSMQGYVLDYFKIYGLTSSVIVEYGKLFPTSRLRYGSGTDLFQQAIQFLDCVGIASMSACVTAKGDADTATTQAQLLYPTTLHNGTGDAFRHCLWSALMTFDLGANTALKIGNMHEQDSPNPPDEKAMDLANNATGRALGVYVISHNDAKLQCKFYADAGLLVTLY